MKLVEVGDYNSTNQDPPIPKLTSEGDFPYLLKKCQAKLFSVMGNFKFPKGGDLVNEFGKPCSIY